MVEYVIGDNPDDRILEKAKKALQDGGVISFPTDTHWVLAASPFSKKGVEEIYKIKGVDRKKHLSLLCSSISQASDYAIISNSVFKMIKRVIPGHYTFIFPPTRDLPKVIKAYERDREIGIRFPVNRFTQILLEHIDQPLITTSLIPSMLEGEEFFDADNEFSEIYSYQIEDMLGNHLKMILDPNDFEIVGDSTVIDFSQDDQPVILREGQGDISIFL